ncbi:MAG: DUF2975 domain-containing protein [Ignavibacteriales bacterium]|nr:DUF2975 domain-containing protein [Ignavibacteriales bacterium]
MFSKYKKLPTVSIYSLLSILTGMSGFVTILTALLPIFSFLKGEKPPTLYGINISIEVQKTGEYVNRSVDFFIHNMKGNLIIINPSTFVAIIGTLIPFLIFSAATLVLLLLRKLFKNVYAGNYFVFTNRKIMYQIASICILVPIIVGVLKKIILDSFPADSIINDLKINLPGIFSEIINSLFPEYLLLGLLFILFANVFREGEKMKEEIDLTI